ncbi:MAG: hypothetical protein HQL71_02535 [Magnetococcales bacterium]|nr:hypothetical protein [Magnetococcales bacterium]
MLTIKCSSCRKKLWKYEKLGNGEVLRCHKSRIKRMYDTKQYDGKIHCVCGRPIGIDKGSHFSMDKKAFTYSGNKVSKL